MAQIWKNYLETWFNFTSSDQHFLLVHLKIAGHAKKQYPKLNNMVYTVYMYFVSCKLTNDCFYIYIKGLRNYTCTCNTKMFNNVVVIMNWTVSWNVHVHVYMSWGLYLPYTLYFFLHSLKVNIVYSTNVITNTLYMYFSICILQEVPICCI